MAAATTASIDGGFRVERNWRRAVASWRGIVNPVKHHHQTLELIMALAGPSMQKAYDEFRADPAGRKLIDERPAILDVLLDEEYLSSLPKGSLGHAYRDFMTQSRLDAALYDQAHDLPEIASNLGWDDEFTYVIHRGIVLHDMLHVLGSYGPDIGGEIGVIGFTHGQAPNLGTFLFVFFALALPMRVGKRRTLRYWREAVARGRRTKILMAQPYEDLLARDVEEVRRELGVLPVAEAHPGGIVYTAMQLGRKKDRMTEQAYARYVYDPTREHMA